MDLFCFLLLPSWQATTSDYQPTFTGTQARLLLLLHADTHFSRDILLTNIMLYWITGAIGSSFWPYYARFHEPWIVPSGEKVMVPTGYAEFPREILTPPRSLAELTYGNITRWTPMHSGGHFAALEAPQ